MKLAVILGSSRETRASDRLAKWVVSIAKTLPGTTVELLDLKDYPMVFFDEAISPQSNPDRHPKPAVQKWLDKLLAADAYIVVTPEYNHSIPGVLKNALDYIDWQVTQKPFAIVSHGSTGGARATSQLKIIISEINGVVIPQNVALTIRMRENFDEHGNLIEELRAQERGPEVKLQSLLEVLRWYSDALANARAKSS